MIVFKEIFIASLKELIRDRAALFWFLAFPVIFIIIFGIVFSGGGEQQFTVGIVTPGQNPMVEKMVEGIKTIPTFDVKTGSEQEELTALKKGQRSLVIVIPNVNYQAIISGKGYEVPLYYDASRKNTSQVLISVVSEIFSEIENRITGRPKIFEVAPRAVQARRLTDFDYILPGILAMGIMQLGLFGSFQFLSLREQKIIRGLGVTPLPRIALLGSEIIVRLIMSLVQALIIIGIGRLVFHVTIISSLWKVLGLVILGSLTFISLGYMLITFTKTMESGRGIIQLVQFPMMFLSGIFFPIYFMPDYIKPVVRAIPLTYLGDALRQLMVGATPNYTMSINLTVLVVWLAVTFGITVKFWRWE